MQSSMNMNQERSSESTITQISDQFFMNLKLNDDEKAYQGHEFEEAKQFDEEIDENVEDEDVEEDEGDEDFSFSMAFDGVIDQSQITAEEAFANGLIKPVFPFFNQDLLLKEGVNMEELIADNGNLANVKKVFVPATASTSGNDNSVAGPYCDWDKKSVETCKKSNSTGFSKIWRFKDFMHRSSSDGKDAFVFLNDASSAAAAAAVSRKKKEVPGSKVNGDGGKVKVVAGESKITLKGKKVVKSSKKAAPSPHEVYLRSKAKEEKRRRSYHSYRPEVVGLFTNITGGGLTRNVHPF